MASTSNDSFFDAKAFGKRIPPIKYLIYFLAFLLLLYLYIYLISDVSERTRNTLLVFTLVGFAVSYYILNPIIHFLKIHRPSVILLFSVLLVSLFWVAIRNNDLTEAFLKCFFFISGSTIYLYLKYLLFNQ
jgi:hypothetical protein